MNNSNFLYHNDGSILVTILVVLVVMTVMGMVATNTTLTELMIASNDRDYQQDFFVADGGLNAESSLVFSYPVVLTKAEQKNHEPYYIVKSMDGGFPEDNSTDTIPMNATAHYVGNHEYKYAVKFITRKQAIIKGEGARTVDIIFNQIEAKRSGSASLMCQVYRRVAN
ncbi:PilX N-terminal domain-containing pilus assembly protein [Desulfoplanes formicivorans]|uniref:Type 4 fimbrial biogenesis protein PilX N-terminal domain-containing protein n=1 Tax=Desulfoplanes formicivorans TaxID=1592317 RepID=A0A194AIP1_9BACT|nr:PilX N-terminal domain-containing pilus assembly protein [Desulfoplanes formicivorans]GAU08941.1 hypothetical protein DPF_1660 [Desulfoplanes formicivorans]